MVFCQGSCNRVFQPPPQLRGVGIYSHGGRVGLTRADAELRGKWVLKGESALVDSSSPRHGDKASYYTAVCLETGEEEWMELEGNSNGESSVAFLERLRERHGGRLGVIWDNAPAHRGPAMRSYLETPGLNLRLVTCLATARTSTPLRRSGAGQGKRPPETSAWEPKPWCSTGSTTSSPDCAAGRMR